MDIRNTLYSWSKEDCVKFAVWCARRVVYINDDPKVVAAIEAAERWLQDPGEANRSAAHAAHAAAAHAAYAAAYAAYAAAYAAHAAAYAAYAARAAAHAAAARAIGNLTDHDLLQIYINEQILYAVNS